MKAEFDGQDYFIYLDPSKPELRDIALGQLEADLTAPFEKKKLGKKVVVIGRETNHPDGIEVNYLPEGADSWEAIQQVQVLVSSRARVNLDKFGVTGTRYNGSDKIEIRNSLNY